MALDPQEMDRRRFLRWLGGGLLLGGAAALGLHGCGAQPTPPPLVPGLTPSPLVPGLTPSPLVPGPTPSPYATPAGWSWPIRWIDQAPPADLAAWRLTIDGLVRSPRTLTMADLRALSARTLRLRMKCVECWSVPAEWTGVPGHDLLPLAEPLPEGQYVTLHALDGYTSTLSYPELTAGRVYFAYGMDGQDLPVEQGFPLRLIAPSKYGYKCVKAIWRLEFVDRRVPGYWESRGYDDVATIQPGLDHPLDLSGVRTIQGGEITEY